MIGLAATLLMAILGRVMGATGIFAGILRPASCDELGWQLALVGGMVSGPVLYMLLTGHMPVLDVPVPTPMLLISGLIVGIGVTYGGGCTSGHGICGIARLSPRSIAATCIFMAFAFATVFLIRHVIGD
ncbi:MAG: YeeE/YedE family protein [Paracoccus sp. (in: a-proteobacteria)]